MCRSNSQAKIGNMILGIAAAALAIGGSPTAVPLKPCTLPSHVAARCGRVAVREDRRLASGRKISLFVAVVRAYGPRPHSAPIFWLSGGPGGAAASDDASFATSVFQAANRTRDIVLVDQRGVGRSAPLLCPPMPQAASDEEIRAYAELCIRTAPRDARFYTTDAAMDDVDVIRQALGYRRIVLYGGSYGATAAQVYLARHGAHVAAAVLDGGTLLDVPIWERMPRATQDAFDRLAARCASDAECHAAFPDVAGDLHSVFAHLRATGQPLGIEEAQNLLRLLLRVPADAARLPLILHRAASGDYTELLQRLNAGAGGVPARPKLMYYAIRCAEGWARDNPLELRRWAAGTEFLEAALVEAEGLPTVCDLLGPPLPAPDTGVVPRSRVPVLFLVGGMDPQDPLENVAAAPQSLPNAHILVAPGAGHGSVQHGCLSQVAMRFFTNRRLSASDRACAAKVRPPPFARFGP